MAGAESPLPSRHLLTVVGIGSGENSLPFRAASGGSRRALWIVPARRGLR